MKTILYTTAAILVAVIASCATLTKAEKDELQAKLKQAVEGKNLRIAVSYVNPTKFTPRTVDGSYDLTLRNDSAIAYLPYFGEVYGGAVPYGGSDGGIMFKAPVEEYKSTGNEKDGYEISFKAKSQRDRYQFFITISTSGYAAISVTPTQASHISYNGEIVFDKTKK